MGFVVAAEPFAEEAARRLAEHTELEPAAFAAAVAVAEGPDRDRSHYP